MTWTGRKCDRPKRKLVPKKEKGAVALSAKQFAERLNECLDETEAPPNVRERAIILSKLLAISRQQAWNLLEGHELPSEELKTKIANEFEVEVEWFSNENKTRG